MRFVQDNVRCLNRHVLDELADTKLLLAGHLDACDIAFRVKVRRSHPSVPGRSGTAVALLTTFVKR